MDPGDVINGTTAQAAPSAPDPGDIINGAYQGDWTPTIPEPKPEERQRAFREHLEAARVLRQMGGRVEMTAPGKAYSLWGAEDVPGRPVNVQATKEATSKMPVAGALSGLGHAKDLYDAGKRFEAGQETDEDRKLVADSIAEQEDLGKRGFKEKALDVASHLPAVAVEWAGLGGVGALGRAAGEKAVGAAAAKVAGATATRLAAKAGGMAGEGLIRTAARPDLLAAGSLSRMAPQVAPTEDGGFSVQPGKPMDAAAWEAARSEAIQNIAFSVGSPFSRKAGDAFLTRWGKGLASGVLSAEGAQELQHWGANAPQGSSLHRFAAARTPEERRAALEDFGAQVAAFGGLEAFVNARRDIHDAADVLKQRGIDPQPEKLHEAAKAALPTPEVAPAQPAGAANRQELPAPEEGAAGGKPAGAVPGEIGNAGGAATGGPAGQGAAPAAQPEPAAAPAPAGARGTRATAPAAPVGFTTAKGSTYEVHEDGTTTRTKAERDQPGHEGDKGQKQRTDRTIYVPSDVAGALTTAGLQNAPKARVVIHDGKATLVTWNAKEERWGATASGRDVPISETPAVGLAPLELWGKVNDVAPEAYKSMHAGNAITEVRQKAPAAAVKEPLEEWSDDALKGLAEWAKVKKAPRKRDALIKAIRKNADPVTLAQIIEANAEPPPEVLQNTTPDVTSAPKTAAAAGVETERLEPPAEVRSEADPDLGYAKYHELYVGGKKAGEMVLGEPGAKMEAAAAERAFPGVVKPGENVARINGIELEKEAQGRGYGQQLYLKAMAQHGADWYYNSQTYPGATNAIKALVKKGLVEAHWDKEPGWGEKGGIHLLRLTEAGREAAQAAPPGPPEGAKAPEVAPKGESAPEAKPGALLTASELHDKLARGEPTGLGKEADYILRRRTVQGDSLRKVAKDLGLSHERVRQIEEAALEKLHGMVQEPGEGTVAEKAPVLSEAERGELSTEGSREDAYDAAHRRLSEQYEKEAEGGKLSDERRAWFESEGRALADEQDAGQTTGPALRRAATRYRLRKKTGGPAAEPATAGAAEPPGGAAAGPGGPAGAGAGERPGRGLDAEHTRLDAQAATLSKAGLAELAAKRGVNVNGTKAEMLKQLHQALDRAAVSEQQADIIGPRRGGAGERPGELSPLAARLTRQLAEARAELARAFPHGRPEGAQQAKGYDDRLSQVHEAEEGLRRAMRLSGERPFAMGAAALGELTPTQAGAEPPTKTALANAQIDKERLSQGLNPIIGSARMENPEAWDAAMRRIDANPDYGRKLVEELSSKPRPADVVEQAAILHEKIRLDNEYRGLVRQRRAATTTGGADAFDLTDLEGRMDAVDRQRYELALATKRTGTELGRSLQFRRQMAAEDYSLQGMLDQAAVAKGKPLTPEEENLIRQMQGHIADLEEQLEQARQKAQGKHPLSKEQGEFKKAVVGSEEAQGRFRKKLADWKQQNRGPAAKVGDWLLKLRQNMVISSPTTLEKLGVTSATRFISTPMEEAVGEFWRRMPGISKIAAMAPREGRGFNWKTEKAALVSGLTEGFADAWKTLRTGQSDLDVLGGKPLADTGPMDWQFRLHAAIKAPAVRAEFTRSVLHRIDHAASQGVDVSNPAAMLRIYAEAYKDSQATKFQQDNAFVDKINKLLTPGKNASGLEHGLAFAGKMAMPVRRIPTNIVAETGNYLFGAAYGTARVANAWRTGFDKLTAAQSEAVMRNLKKGSLGMALMGLGYFVPKMFGGYYREDEKKGPSDVPFKSARIGSVTIPSAALHHPLLDVAQFGATMRQVEDQIKKGQPKGLGEGALAGVLGLGEEVPALRTVKDIGKLLDPRERGYFMGGMMKSLSTPQVVQWLAGRMDVDPKTGSILTGEPVKRKPQGVWQRVEEGVPGLRQRVPVK